MQKYLALFEPKDDSSLTREFYHEFEAKDDNDARNACTLYAMCWNAYLLEVVSV